LRVDAVVRMVREVRQEDHRHVTDFLTRLVESGADDRWEVKKWARSRAAETVGGPG